MEVPEELKRRYLERKIHDLQELRLSLEKNDFDPAILLGHQVKGNAATFEFPQIGPIGIEIENAAKSRNKEALQKLIEQMALEIQNARQTFH